MKYLFVGVSAIALAGVAIAAMADGADTGLLLSDAAPVTESTSVMSVHAPADVAAPPQGLDDTAATPARENTASHADVSAVPLDVAIDGDALPYDIWHHMVMPGETVAISANLPLHLSINGQDIAQSETDHAWVAPDAPGTYSLTATDAAGRERQVTIFVLQPLNGAEVLEGYRIGTYPRDTPDGLIRLTQADMDARISPHFRIGQFICKQQPGHWPKYLLTSGSMLLRLEALLASMQEEDLTDADTFFIMSGYRTPFYNTAIGSAQFSRHMYGDASDIYPDVVGNDGIMDDLDGDGMTTRADAEFLYDYAERLYTSNVHLPAGGIGAYSANAVHGPFVHVDGRGHPARWGRRRT